MAWSPATGSCPFRYPSDPLMMIAWRDFIDFAIRSKEPNFKEWFTKDTGIRWPSAATNGIEKMIDAACGYDRDLSEHDVILKFIEWLNVTQWGENEVQEHPLPAPVDNKERV